MTVAIWPSRSFHPITSTFSLSPVSHPLTVLVIAWTSPPSKKMNPTKLLDFVQSKLMVPLDDEDAQKLLRAKIDGEAFLYAASQTDYFHQAVGLSIGAGLKVEQLAKIAKADTENNQQLKCLG